MQETIDPAVPVAFDDPLNARVLAISEDRVQGFHAEPFREISRLSGVPLSDVLERIRAMLAAGTVRRVRQTLMRGRCRRRSWTRPSSTSSARIPSRGTS
jgi:hypothetical protein